MLVGAFRTLYLSHVLIGVEREHPENKLLAFGGHKDIMTYHRLSYYFSKLFINGNVL